MPADVTSKIDEVAYDTENCMRCGGSHALKLRRLTNPPPWFQWWAMCPTRQEPLFFALWADTKVLEASDGYGRCPFCQAKCKLRERRFKGNDTCENGHVYPSLAAVHENVDVPADFRPWEQMVAIPLGESPDADRG